jgi:hypothetical protein
MCSPSRHPKEHRITSGQIDGIISHLITMRGDSGAR